MDGSVSMLDSSIGAVLQTARVHAKYVVRVLWAPDGASFVTASWDGNVHVFAAPGGHGPPTRGTSSTCHSASAPQLWTHKRQATSAPHDCRRSRYVGLLQACLLLCAGVPSAAGRPESWAEGPHFSRIDSLPFATAVQDVAFVPSGTELVIALRDTNYLRRRKFPDIQVSSLSYNIGCQWAARCCSLTHGHAVMAQQAQESINMNALGDEHVSFSARQLDVSPDGKHLLVSTDSPRILLLRIQGDCMSPTLLAGLQE